MPPTLCDSSPVVATGQHVPPRLQRRTRPFVAEEKNRARIGGLDGHELALHRAVEALERAVDTARTRGIGARALGFGSRPRCFSAPHDDRALRALLSDVVCGRRVDEISIQSATVDEARAFMVNMLGERACAFIERMHGALYAVEARDHEGLVALDDKTGTIAAVVLRL